MPLPARSLHLARFRYPKFRLQYLDEAPAVLHLHGSSCASESEATHIVSIPHVNNRAALERSSIPCTGVRSPPGHWQLSDHQWSGVRSQPVPRSRNARELWLSKIPAVPCQDSGFPSWSSRGLVYAFLFAHEHACLVRPSPPLSCRPCAPLFRPSPLPSIELPHGDFLHPSVIEVMQLVLWPLGHLRV